jgi:hypothetical protein
VEKNWYRSVNIYCRSIGGFLRRRFAANHDNDDLLAEGAEIQWAKQDRKGQFVRCDSDNYGTCIFDVDDVLPVL